MRRFLPYNHNLALLILRLTLAAVLLYHGIPKLLHFGEAIASWQNMDLPSTPLIDTPVAVTLAVLAEPIGGFLILLGVIVDLAGLLVVIDMLGAIILVHLPNGFDFTEGGWEHPFTVLGMALALALAGPGRYAIGKRDYQGAERRRRGERRIGD